MTSVTYVQDEAGNMFIPPTQRPDGTWRKPIPVRPGYVPPEEQPLYVSKGRQPTERSKFPVGLSAADFEQSSGGARGSRSAGTGTYFEVGRYEPTTVIPGLNFVTTNDDETEKKKKNKKKTKSKSGNESNETPESTKSKINSGAAAITSTKNHQALPNSNEQGGSTDPAKRLRNLRKKLKDIESLETKLKGGELPNPDPDQLEKIKRKEAVIDEIGELVAALNL